MQYANKGFTANTRFCISWTTNVCGRPNGHLDVHLLQDCIRLALLSGRQLGVQQGSMLGIWKRRDHPHCCLLSAGHRGRRDDPEALGPPDHSLG